MRILAAVFRLSLSLVMLMSPLAASAQEQTGGVVVSIINTTAAAVTVVAVGDGGAQQALAQVGPGERQDLSSAAGTLLGFAQGDHWLGGGYRVAGKGRALVFLPFEAASATKASAQPVADAGAAASPQSNADEPPAKASPKAGQRKTDAPAIRVTNASDASVAVVAVDAAGEQQLLAQVATGETAAVAAATGITLGFAQGEQWIGDPYVVKGSRGEAVSVPYRQTAAAEPGGTAEPAPAVDPSLPQVRIANKTGASVLVIGIGTDTKQTALYELPAGQAYSQSVAAGTTLGFSQNQTWVGDGYTVTGAGNETVSVPYKAVEKAAAAEPRPAGSVDVQFVNGAASAIVVAAVGSDDAATRLYEIPAGQTVTRPAMPKARLYFYPKDADSPIGDSYVVKGKNDNVVIPYDALAALKARQAGAGSISLEMRNETFGDIYVATAGEDGARADLYTIKYRNTAKTGIGTPVQVLPGTQLYFYSQIMETVDGKKQQKLEGGLLVPPNGPGIIYIPYDETTVSQKQPNPPGSIGVMFKSAGNDHGTLTFANAKSERVFSLLGSLETWRNLQPNSVLYVYGRNKPGDTEDVLLGDPVQVGTQAGVQFTVPLPSTQGAAPAPAGQASPDVTAAMAKIDLKGLSDSLVLSVIQSRDDAKEAKICWKDSYGRGAGKVPRACPPGQSEDTAGLCYDTCRAGYKGALTMCVPSCPAGFRDDGLHCFKPPPITRDSYAWKFGDGLNMNDAMGRCRARHGKDCVVANANTMVYSTCPAGYAQAPVVTNLCSPICPTNTTDIGISCQKNTYDRGSHLMACAGGQQNDAGLCYDNCRSGFAGVGPVCWNACPKSLPVNCGASCGKTTAECAQSITDQVTTPIMTAANVALIAVTAGGAAGAAVAANAAKAAAETGGRAGAEMAVKAAAKETARQALKASVKAALKSSAATALKAGATITARDLAIGTAVSAVITGAMTVGMSEKAKNDLKAALTDEVKKQLANQITDAQIDTAVNTAMASVGSGVDFDFSSLDPTGIASIVMAYNLPLCSDVK